MRMLSRRHNGLQHLLLAGLLTAPAAAVAQGPTNQATPALASGPAAGGGTVRVGDHPGFGRVVFEFGASTGFEVVGQGERILIVFEGAPSIPAVRSVPKNVRAIEAGVGSATLQLALGARIRTSRIGNRVVVDVLDPPRIGSGGRSVPSAVQRSPAATPAITIAQPAASPASPEAEAPLGSVQRPALDTPAPSVFKPDIAPRAAVPSGVAPSSAPLIPVMQDPLPAPSSPSMSGTVASAYPAIGAQPSSVLLTAELGVGAAAFRRADTGVLVLDQRIPIDLSTMAMPLAFAGASVQLGQTSSVLTFPLAPSQRVTLSREPLGWRMALTAGDAAEPDAIQPAIKPGGLLLVVDRPGQVVSIADPSTGSILLVGTVNQAAGPGPATLLGRRAPGFALAPTWLGVAVEPLSDQIELRPVAAGFMLTAPGVLPGTDPSVPVAQAFTRRFDFPDLPVPALLQRLKAQVAAAAAAPPRARTTDRVAAAQSLLSLGLATEAQAILALVAAEDPAAAADPGPIGLMAIAALLAGRSGEAGGLDDPRLDGTDDLALWRGIRDAMRDTDPDAGRSLPRLLPLASGYPAALRDRLRPLVVEAAVATNQAAAVAAALAAPNDPTLDYARALRQEREGDPAAALQAYDALASGRDQLIQVRAGVRAAELRLRQGTLTPAAVADKLERYAATWRGDAREGRIRLRVAELRTAAGAFRPALEVLREAERLFPDLQPTIRTAMAAVFQDMLTRPEAISPIELVTLASDFAGLLPNGAGGGIATLLAEKLVALDLPARAGPVLAALMATAGQGPARAGIGARLAQLQLDAGALTAAQATLRSSEAPDLPAALAETRTLLMAQISAGKGDLQGATMTLVALGTAAADDLRARMLSQAADWPGSLAALSDLAAKTVSADGPLTEAMQDIVLRQATSAVQANDAALLKDLRRRHATRLAGPRADLFRLLTADPLRGPSDLPRAATELALARVLPDRLQGLSLRSPP